MPAQGVVNTDSSKPNEMDAVVPTVSIFGGLTDDGSNGMQTRDWITCMAIERRLGLVPSSAELKFGNQGYDLTGPNTLNAWQLFDPGARTQINNGEEIMFLGGLWKRRDQGITDSLVWTALDDRILLWKIPIRGALVYDQAETDPLSRVKFISGYTARTNPNGFWNCCPAFIDDMGNVPAGSYPVFLPEARREKTYESPDEAFLPNDMTARAGTRTAWTPRRWLQYLWLLANLPANSLQGTFDRNWRSLASSTRLSWPNDISNLQGKDPSDTNIDPLDRKMPDITFRGMKMAGAIQRTLEICGTHDVRLDYNYDENENPVSEIQFVPDGVSGRLLPIFMDINVQRGGPAGDPNTGFDFDVFEDSSEIADAVLVEGARHRSEGRLNYLNQSNDAIKPAWNSSEETCFLQIITGNPATANGSERFAWYPEVIGSVTNALVADGNSNRPLVYAGTPEAIQFARSFFPRVYKAFRFNFNNSYSNANDPLLGYARAFSNESVYPKIYSSSGRRAVSTQLQYMIEDVYGNADITNGLLQKFPLRLEIDTSKVVTGSNTWIDVQAGIHFTDDGMIWIEAAEEHDGRPDCIYSGGLLYLTSLTDTNGAASVRLNHFRINMPVLLDHRVKGYKELPSTWSLLSDNLWNELGGPFLEYVDSPNAYHEDHQVNSYPSQFSQYYAGNTAIDGTSGLNRLLPPGSEATHAEYAAQRRLANTRWPQRRSTWKMVGIRADYQEGTWIRQINVYGHENPDVNDTAYDINAPLKSVVYDFEHQTTILGGLISQLSYARGVQSRVEAKFTKLDTAFAMAKAVDAPPKRDPLMDALRGSLGDGGGMYA